MEENVRGARDAFEEEMEARERAYERREDRLIQDLNAARQENLELKLEIAHLESELANWRGTHD